MASKSKNKLNFNKIRTSSEMTEGKVHNSISEQIGWSSNSVVWQYYVPVQLRFLSVTTRLKLWWNLKLLCLSYYDREVFLCHSYSSFTYFNPLKPELNSICYLLALLAHHFLHVSRIRVKSLNFRWLMSYIYIWSTHSWCF